MKLLLRLLVGVVVCKEEIIIMIDELLSDDDEFHHLGNHFSHHDLDDDDDDDEHDDHLIGHHAIEEEEHQAPRAALTERRVEQLSEISSEAIKVELTYVVGKEKMPLSALKELREGSVLPISGPPDFPVTIFVQDKPVAIGQLVLVESTPSIQVKHILT